MEGGYVNIQLKWLSEWRLSPAEALVYGYLYGWLKEQRTVPFRQTQAEIARALGMHTNTLSNTINALVKKGLIERGRDWKIITYKICHSQNLSVTKIVDDTHKICELSPTKIVDDTLSNTSYNTSNTVDDEARVRTRIIKKGEQQPQQPEQQQPLGGEAVVLSVDELAAEMRTELEQGARWAESAMRLHHITGSQLAAALNTFADTLTAAGTTVKSRGDYRKHFSNWLRIQVQTKQLDNNGNKQSKPDTLPGTTISREYIERQLAIIANATKR